MNSKTIVSGQLLSDTDSWLLANERVIVLDVDAVADFDGTLERSVVSALGTLAPSAPHLQTQKLSVEALVSQERVRSRAYEIFESTGGSATDHWLRAERELLGA
jgi:hypothetical protein